MQKILSKSNPALPLFLIFISAHLICWTLIPIIVRYNLPMDSIEGAIWGQQLEWGYDKNPFLNGWLTAFAIYIGGNSGWAIYLFSQLAVSICFLAVFLLARKMVPPLHALVAVIMLEGVQYYNFHAIDFNDNTLELCTWGLTVYFFYCATTIKNHDLKASGFWMLTGIFASLGIMAKYYTIMLLLALFLFLISQPEGRRQLQSWPPYLGLIVCVAIMMPHIVWLFQHDFITIDYVFMRTKSDYHLSNHVFFPAQFAWQQFQVLIPPSILFAIILLCERNRSDKNIQITRFNRRFLLYAGCGPFLLTLLLAFCLGIKLRAGWGMPLFSLYGLLLVGLFRPSISKKTSYRFFLSSLLLMAILLAGYIYSLTWTNTRTSANFPGKELANIVTAEWSKRYHTKLSYVAGPRWIAGNVSFYSPDHPHVFMEWNKHTSPWINLTDLQKKGAVFVWDMEKNPGLKRKIQAQYPALVGTEILQLHWKGPSQQFPAIQIGVAYLPPAASALSH